MQKKIKVDFVAERGDIKTPLQWKAFYELYNRLCPYIDPNIIYWKLWSFPIFDQMHPDINAIISCLHNPYLMWRRKRRNSIIFLATQMLAYFLNCPMRNKKILLCYDIIPFLELNGKYEFFKNKALNEAFINVQRKGLKRADRIISPSNFTKQEIIRHFKFPADKIDVIHFGIDRARYRPIDCHSEILGKYKLPEKYRYILHVGTEFQRKNIVALLRAFSKLKGRLKNLKLIRVGSPGPERRKLLELINELNLQTDVVFLDIVPEDDLPKLYNAVDLLVFPSLYEGFGLPPLEAMACGTPVITSNTTSLPEVVGNAGIMVDPKDINALADAMFKVLTDKALEEEMKAKGLERAKLFDWEKTANEVLQVFQGLSESDK